MPSTPLFAFGYALSYTTFSYSPLKLDSDTFDVGGELRLYLTVTNTQKRRGIEIVQIYVFDTATAITLPVQQLVGFARLDLEPGTSKKVSLVIPMSLLCYRGISRIKKEDDKIKVCFFTASEEFASNYKNVFDNSNDKFLIILKPISIPTMTKQIEQFLSR